MEKVQQTSIEFIKNELIPEMVHNRCFCDPGSREFVEFNSVDVEFCKNLTNNKNREIYRAKVQIKFSDEPKIFYIIVKLLPLNSENDDLAYNCFLNEEMFYNKMTAQYQLDVYPKCYAADMGRYERPVIVLEDLEAAGFIQSIVKLDEDHLQMYLKAISRFHGRGYKLKYSKLDIFREFYVKLSEIMIKNDYHIQSINKVLDHLRDKKSQQESGEKIVKEVKKIIGHFPKNLDNENDESYTICHGNVDQNHLFFRYENNKPVEIKILGWNQLKYSLPGIDLQFINLLDFDKLVNGALSTSIIKKFDSYFSVLTVECPNLSKDILLTDFVLSVINCYIFPSISS
ncbi:uncharacterized protein [Chelonus insularis]|uniref:uncharacterized protein n=1 Tax=Chelonus insularis TaxID=460826 RepID=UPI001588C953|nr:uncharacterized protein LOC118069696 [Chelonus insularis]XP_034943870.1 uncharacterized protein LOC118069696 [Chelonus insularis]